LTVSYPPTTTPPLHHHQQLHQNPVGDESIDRIETPWYKPSSSGQPHDSADDKDDRSFSWNPLQGALIAFRRKQHSSQQESQRVSQFVSSLAGSDFDFVDVAPSIPDRNQSIMETRHSISESQEYALGLDSPVQSRGADESFQDSAPSLPQRLESQVEESAMNESPLQSRRAVVVNHMEIKEGLDKAPSKPNRRESTVA